MNESNLKDHQLFYEVPKPITLFSTPKPFLDNISIIQNNAIRSWTKLQPSCEVILFGDEKGTAEITTELGIKHVPVIESNSFGTPLISSMFKITQEMASNEIICYINADIILMSNFIQAIQQIRMKQFLIVGQRWDIDICGPINFHDNEWEIKLKNNVNNEGVLHSIKGIDYFIFPKRMYNNLPPLAVGRPGWDNWLIYYTRFNKIPVINATSIITAVHQNHGHTNYPGGETAFWEGPEAKQNIELAGGKDNNFHLGYANWELTKRGLQRSHGLPSLWFTFRSFPILHPKLHFLLPIVKLPGRIIGFIRKINCH